MSWRILTWLGDRLAPEGFECDRCGFLFGDEIDRRYHVLAHDIADDPRYARLSVGEALVLMAREEAA